MPRGGKRPGAGRKPSKTGFREWCRNVVLAPEVLENMQEHAKTNPDFALKLAEHGFGRPPAHYQVTVDDHRIQYEALFATGEAVSTSAPQELPN